MAINLFISSSKKSPLKREGAERRGVLLPLKIILWFLVILVMFFLFEISLRIIWTPPVDDRQQFSLEYDPLYGWRKIPNAQGMHRTSEYEVFESFNSKGIRGPEYSYSNHGNEFRVLVLGDSHAEGYSVKFQDLFSEMMKRALNRKNSRHYEVINAGTSGYSTDQELLFFQNEGKKYQPDLTLLMLSPNNIWYNNQTGMSRWYKPHFQLKEGKLQLTHVPVPKPDESFSYRVRQFLKKNSYVSKFIYEKITHTKFYSWLNQWGLTPFSDHLRVWQRNYIPSVRDSWQVTEALLVKLKQEVESSGSRFFIFYVPLPDSVYPEVWEEKRKKYAMSEAEWDPLKDSRELETICSKHGIDFLNPVQRFRTVAAQLKGSGGKLYSFKDEHWTVAGHQLAGEILYEYISQSPLERGGAKRRGVSLPSPRTTAVVWGLHTPSAFGRHPSQEGIKR